MEPGSKAKLLQALDRDLVTGRFGLGFLWEPMVREL